MQILGLAHAGDALSEPPSYPDKVHVLNGCHLSTYRYLAQLKADFPGESGEPLTICLPNAERNHAVALFTWRGQLWCRDEYFGVFPLECGAEPRPKLEDLVERTETLLRLRAVRAIRRGGAPWLRPAQNHMSADERLAEVVKAERIVPFRTTLYWIQTGSREVPIILFRPAGQLVAVYDPTYGTCLAKSACADDAKVVIRVASQLGYAVDGIRTG